MPVEIYSGETLATTLPGVLTASICEKLDGTLTFDFTALQKGAVPISPGMIAKHDGQYYSIVRVKRGFTGGMESSAVSCEHISYILNDAAYNLVTFVFEGYPQDGLARLLQGTPFTVGIVEPTAIVECAFTDKSPLNRRSALMRFADTCGGELEYDGYAIHIRTHRGSITRKTLMDGKNVTSLSATFDSRKGTQAYEIRLHKLVALSVGEEVNITYRPLSIHVDTRIVGLTYNPFDRHTVRMEVGDYMPNLLAAQAERLEGIVQTFTAANGRLESKMTDAEGAISLLQQNISGISTRIQDAEGNISALSQTVGGFNARIETAEGAVATMGLTVDGFNVRLTDAEGNFSALSQTVDGFDARITDAEGNVSQLTQTVNSFDTRISDVAGSVSTITQNVNSITTRVTNAEQDISTVEQTANKISWIVASGSSSSNFTLTSKMISLVSAGINITGYVTINALKTAGQTVINGGNITTGSIKAERIASGTLTSMTISNANIKMDGSSITFLNANGAIKRGTSGSLQNILSFTSQAMVIGAYSGNAVNTLSIPMQTITLGYSASYTTLTLSANTTNSGTFKCTGAATFSGSASHASTSSFTGAATFNGTATFASTCTHNGTTNLKATSVSGALSCSSTATFSGATRFTGSIGFYGASAVSKVSVATCSAANISTVYSKLNELINRLKTMGLV